MQPPIGKERPSTPVAPPSLRRHSVSLSPDSVNAGATQETEPRSQSRIMPSASSNNHHRNLRNTKQLPRTPTAMGSSQHQRSHRSSSPHVISNRPAGDRQQLTQSYSPPSYSAATVNPRSRRSTLSGRDAPQSSLASSHLTASRDSTESNGATGNSQSQEKVRGIHSMKTDKKGRPVNIARRVREKKKWIERKMLVKKGKGDVPFRTLRWNNQQRPYCSKGGPATIFALLCAC